MPTRTFSHTPDPVYDCPVAIPKHWKNVGDMCGKQDCFHDLSCDRCSFCPCHCVCPPPMKSYAEEFQEQSRHYYDSGRD